MNRVFILSMDMVLTATMNLYNKNLKKTPFDRSCLIKMAY